MGSEDVGSEGVGSEGVGSEGVGSEGVGSEGVGSVMDRGGIGSPVWKTALACPGTPACVCQALAGREAQSRRDRC